MAVNHSTHSWNDIRHWLHKLVDRVDYIENNCCGSSGSGVPSTIFGITSLMLSPSQLEIGQTLTNTNITWSYNFGDPDIQTITSLGNISPTSLRSTQIPTISTSTSFTLTATKGIITDNKTVTISVKRQRYWGATSIDYTQLSSILNNTLLTDGILNELSLDRAQSRNIDCTGGKYFYFLWPVVYGLGSFLVNSLPFSGFSRDINNDIFVINITNQYGYMESYYLYKSKNLLYGNNIPIVII